MLPTRWPSCRLTASVRPSNPPPGVSGSGTILLPLNVTGSVGIVSTTVVGQPPILTQAGFSIFCATTTLAGPGGGVCGGSNPFGFSVSVPHPPQFIFDHSQPVDMSLLLTVPFTFGQEFLLDRQVWFTAGEIPQRYVMTVTFKLRSTGTSRIPGRGERRRFGMPWGMWSPVRPSSALPASTT